MYEIHLHPTYRVPCLWFTLHDLPPDEPAFNIDTVFRRLVPDEYKEGLRGSGPIGGISADVSHNETLPAAQPRYGDPLLLRTPLPDWGCHVRVRMLQTELPHDLAWARGRLRRSLGSQGDGYPMSRRMSSFVVAIFLHCHVVLTLVIV